MKGHHKGDSMPMQTKGDVCKLLTQQKYQAKNNTWGNARYDKDVTRCGMNRANTTYCCADDKLEDAGVCAPPTATAAAEDAKLNTVDEFDAMTEAAAGDADAEDERGSSGSGEAGGNSACGVDVGSSTVQVDAAVAEEEDEEVDRGWAGGAVHGSGTWE